MPQQAIELILLRSLANYLSIPILAMDASGRLLFCNKPAETLLVSRQGSFAKMGLQEVASFFETLEQANSPVELEVFPLTIALRQGQPAHGHLLLRMPDGISKTVELTAFPLKGQGVVIWVPRQSSGRWIDHDRIIVELSFKNSQGESPLKTGFLLFN